MKNHLIDNPRYIAFKILLDSNRQTQDNLAETLKNSKLTLLDKALVTQLVQGINREKLFLDWAIGLTSSYSKIDKEVKILLYLGAYQILCLHKIPPYAAIYETVETGKSFLKPHIIKYINGVLRSIDRKKSLLHEGPSTGDTVKDMSVYYSHPEWMIKRWMKRWGKNFTEKICKFNNSPPPLTIRVNTMKTDIKELSLKLQEKNIPSKPLRFIPEGLEITENVRAENLSYYKEGLFTLQGESSMFPAKILSPEQEDSILDLCAAPGNKTTHTGELMNNRGKILAVDISGKRLKTLNSNCIRLGIDIVNTMVSDIMELKDKVKEDFNGLLLDAPCSGTGVLSRHSDSRWKRSIDDIKRLSLIQKKMIDEAANFVKPGGSMVYSVCSIEPEEGEDVVKNFIEGNKDFSLDVSLENFFHESENKSSHGLLLLPPLHGIEGFFVAKLRRTLKT